MCFSVKFLLPLYLTTYEFLGDTPEYRCKIPELSEWTNDEIFKIAIPYE